MLLYMAVVEGEAWRSIGWPICFIPYTVKVKEEEEEWGEERRRERERREERWLFPLPRRGRRDLYLATP